MFYVAFQMVRHEAFVKCEIEGGRGVGQGSSSEGFAVRKGFSVRYTVLLFLFHELYILYSCL